MSNKHYSYFLKLLVFGLKAPSLKEFVRVTLFNQFDVNTQFSCVKKLKKKCNTVHHGFYHRTSMGSNSKGPFPGSLRPDVQKNH